MYDQPTSSPSCELEFGDDDMKTVTVNDIIDIYAPATSPPDTSELHEDTFAHDLYNGTQISVGLSLILIMSFVINHSFTDAALRDLLQIISLHCPSPNLCITSLYIFKKYFAATKFNFKRHYYCPFCKSSIDHLQLKCPNIACEKKLSNTDRSYFIEVSILEQLQNMFRRPGFYNKLQHLFLRTKRHQHGIEDVYDGQLYTALMKPGQFLANPRSVRNSKILIQELQQLHHCKRLLQPSP